MNDHFIGIYQSHAAEYRRMIAAEDRQGLLLKTMDRIAPLKGKRLLDLGTGTGRIPIALAASVDSLTGIDLHFDMLREHARQRNQMGGIWPLVQSDMRSLPFPARSFDIVTAGWAIGHFTGWHSNWREESAKAITEMKRVIERDGTLFIIETMSTGSKEPAPPTPALKEYYAWLENDLGFQCEIIPFDFDFNSEEDAIDNTAFFFGEWIVERIRANHWSRIPSWAGIWHTT